MRVIVNKEFTIIVSKRHDPWGLSAAPAVATRAFQTLSNVNVATDFFEAYNGVGARDPPEIRHLRDTGSTLAVARPG